MTRPPTDQQEPDHDLTLTCPITVECSEPRCVAAQRAAVELAATYAAAVLAARRRGAVVDLAPQRPSRRVDLIVYVTLTLR